MINQEKVKDMTKMAIYESHGGDKELATSAYRRKDYIAVQMIKSFICGTISCVILILFYLIFHLDQIEAVGSLSEVQGFGTGALIFYIIFMAIFMLVTYIWARKRHNRCCEQAKSYSTELNRVARSYQMEDDD